jgi:hypothetical protein
MRTGPVLQPPEHRKAELMQRGERKLHLELGALGAQELKAAGVIAGEPQQGRFADPRIPFDNERPAMADARRVQQEFERRHLGRSPPERVPPGRRLRIAIRPHRRCRRSPANSD